MRLRLAEGLQMMIAFFHAQERAVRQSVAPGNAPDWRLESVKLTQPEISLFTPVTEVIQVVSRPKLYCFLRHGTA